VRAVDVALAHLAHLAHLARRFVSSLVAREPSEGDTAVVRGLLLDTEFAVWEAMPRPDRVEGLATLRRLPLDVAADERWAAAALLHDAGKSVANLNTFGRAVATVGGMVMQRERITGRAGAYLRHPELGAALLHAVGARPEVVAWAECHHDPARWPRTGIPAEVCAALAAADGERVRSRG
jgi:hypothetical protein